MRLLTIGSIALLATTACGGDDSTSIQLPSDSGGGGDTLTTDGGGNNPDSSGNPDTGVLPDSSVTPDSSVADASTFNVKNVLGLALWLDATKGITANNNAVTKWADQSGNANDAFSLNANFQPHFVASLINNQPALHFKANAGGQGNGYGNIMNILDSPMLNWGTGDYLIEVVGQYKNNEKDANINLAVGTFYSKQMYSNNPPFVTTGPDLYGNIPASNNVTTSFGGSADLMNGVTSANTGFNNGKPHVFAIQRVGNALDLRVDGAQTDTKNISNVNVDSVKVGARIGASGDATIARLDGDIAEVIAVKGTITSQDLAGIEGYLKTKYGL